MPQPSKPGVDWARIEERYRAGETSSALAREFPISRQAIDKRARKEGWVADAHRARLRNATVATVAKERSPFDRYGQRHPDNIARALELAEQGNTQALIAYRLGMTPSAFNKWKESDAEFNVALHEAWARHTGNHIGYVNKAAERGDARAAQWMLERSPVARDDFAPTAKSNGGPDLRVILNIPRSMEELEAMQEDKVIEGQFTNADETPGLPSTGGK